MIAIPDYKQMYFELAAKVADAIELLTFAQQQGENRYVEHTPPPPLKLEKCAEEAKKNNLPDTGGQGQTC